MKSKKDKTAAATWMRFGPNPTPAATVAKLTPGVAVRFHSEPWTRQGPNDHAPFNGTGTVVSGPLHGSILIEYVSPAGVAVRAWYATGWTRFEII